MAIIHKRQRALSDLDDIWLYIAQDNIGEADRLIDLIEEKCRLLAETPMLGRKRDELLPDLRSFSIGNYIIFYKPIENGIDIIRVLHGSRDIGSFF